MTIKKKNYLSQKKFWDKFYKNNNKNNRSSFANFIKKKYLIKKKGKLLDIGCGDGRDSFFFSNQDLKVYGIDKSKIATQNNQNVVKKYKFMNLFFFSLDILSKKIFKLGKFDFIYSRFFLHTINERTQRKIFLNILNKIIKEKTLCFFEFRTIKDDLYKVGIKKSKYERITDHYRRFIDVNNFLQKNYIKKKFKVLYLVEKKNLSIYKRDNPVVCRLVLKKNKIS